MEEVKVWEWKKQNKKRFRACLDSPKTECNNLVFLIHHLKLMGPTNDAVFSLVLDVCFHHSKTQNFEFG